MVASTEGTIKVIEIEVRKITDLASRHLCVADPGSFSYWVMELEVSRLTCLSPGLTLTKWCLTLCYKE